MTEIKVFRLPLWDQGQPQPLPKRAKLNDAGFDLRTPYHLVIPPGKSEKFGVGFGFEIPAGWYGQILDRSSMGEKGLIIPGGVIDSDYRGEVQIVLWNVSDRAYSFPAGSKVAQIIFLPTYTEGLIEITASQASQTERATNGFGSTGV